MTLAAVASKTCHARSGLAAYNAHTSQLVTAARHEPIGSILEVRNPQTGRKVTVRVNDRGPFNGNRILDLSTGAFKALYGGLGRGVGPVDYVVVSRGGSPRARSQQWTQGKVKTHHSWRGHHHYKHSKHRRHHRR
jgi:rare lipoprotein A